MSKMLVDRAALEQALQSLKMCRALIRDNIEQGRAIGSPNPFFSFDVDKAITSLSDTLKQPVPNQLTMKERLALMDKLPRGTFSGVAASDAMRIWLAASEVTEQAHGIVRRA